MDRQGYKVLKKYFCSGWAFFLSYLFFYLIFWFFEWGVSTLLQLFTGIHVLHAIGLCWLISGSSTAINLKNHLFWVSLAFLFLLTGAYLEFPADPWTHFWRISQWNNIALISDANSNHKFSYFFGYSLIGWIPPKFQISGIDFYYCFWGLLLAFQFYKLAIRLGFSEPWAKVAVLGTIIFMGNSSFSFYRYYGISSTMLSTITYLGATNAFIDYLKSKKTSKIFSILFCLFLSFWNHQQGLLLFFASFIGILLYSWHARIGNKKFIPWIAFLFLFTTAIFYLFLHLPIFPEFRDTINPIWDSKEWLFGYGGFKLFSMDPQINNASGRMLQILGAVGSLNLLIGIYFIKHKKLVGWITFSPVLLLLYPPFAVCLTYLLSKYNQIVVFHRLLFAIPMGFCLVFSLQLLSFKKLKIRYFKSYILTPITAMLFILLSLPNKIHYFGRFQNVFLRSNNTINLREVFKVSQFCKEHLTLDENKSLLCDKASQFILKASSGEGHWNYFVERHIPEDLSSRISSLGGIENVLKNNDIVGVLALDRELQTNPQGSLLAKSSGHWDDQILSKNLVYDKNLEEKLQVLEKNGWVKTSVSLFYNLYLRP
jgi:hypothetical protein